MGRVKRECFSGATCVTFTSPLASSSRNCWMLRNCIHCTVTSNHADRIDEYLEDLQSAVTYLETHPEHQARGNAAMYGMIAKVPFRGMVQKSVMAVMETLYGPRAAEPGFDPMSEDDEGTVMRLVKSYGSRALAVLDRVDKLRERFSPGKKRRRSVT